MAGQHVVAQGECLVKIAARYGFQDFRTLYNDGGNAEFRRKRANPSILYPGDVLAIPEKEVKEVLAATGRLHRFVLPTPHKILRVALRDAHGKPIANEPVTVAASRRQERRTDGDGRFEVEMPIAEATATLEVRGQTLPLDLCYLNPVDATPDEGASGVQHRLRNLGYYHGPLTGEYDRPTRLALWLFQFDQEMPTDGRPAPETLRRLVKEHGC